MSLKQRAVEMSKNQKALAGLVKIGAFLVIFAVVFYCDIQFIQVMFKTFPDGAAKIFSLVGAVATGASVVALIGAEAYWFSRGPQMVFGYVFTGLEVLISIANVILSFEMTSGHIDQFMAAYLWFCPATPVVAAICWVIVFNLNEGQKARHDHREMQDDIAEADRDHTKAVHESKMKLKTRYLESTTTYLEQIADDPRIQAGLQAGAWKFATDELRNLTGLVMSSQAPQLPAGTVEGSLSPASQTAKTTEKKPDPEPDPPTKPGWFKNPFKRDEQSPAPVNRPNPIARTQNTTQPPQQSQPRPHPARSVADIRRARRSAKLRPAPRSTQPSPAESDTSYADDLAASVPPPQQREPEYVVNRPSGHDTEQLPKAHAPAPSGASLNGH